ncbi:MAG: flagellar hook assembly protein FlgD [Synergistaceae bacterium]|jgi:flagellar basal-body rod modification protein FlgD|nr:flagellar hook assembly protein FlgD [Synergistaceae bacterium]
MATINNVTGGWTSYEDTVQKTPSNELGKEDFLKLLVAQLTHQDPTNPMQDTEFVSQLATYSGLEQQMTMNKNLETLIASNNATTAAAAMSLIGSVVGFTNDNGELQMGQVLFLDIVAGEVNLFLTDGTYVPFSKVEQIGLASTGSGGSETGDTGTSGDDDIPEE